MLVQPQLFYITHHNHSNIKNIVTIYIPGVFLLILTRQFNSGIAPLTTAHLLSVLEPKRSLRTKDPNWVVSMGTRGEPAEAYGFI